MLHSLLINVSVLIGKAGHFASRLQMPSLRLGELAGSRMQLRGCRDTEQTQTTAGTPSSLLCYDFSLVFYQYCFNQKPCGDEYTVCGQTKPVSLSPFQNRENVVGLGRGD